MTDATPRPAAKVLLIGPDHSVLLFRGGDPGRPEDGSWWFPPGGGVEPGETVTEAARRELAEETGLVVDELGPVVHRRHAVFEFDGQLLDSVEDYFVVRRHRFEVDGDGWTEVERSVIEEYRWWLPDELSAVAEPVYPENVAWLVETHATDPGALVSASRRIAAPPAAVFAVLADPVRHPELDGSGMVRGGRTTAALAGVGDVFTIAMHFPALGDYEMDNHVVEFEPDRRIGWEPAAGRGHPGDGAERWGHRWSYALQPDGADATIVTEIYDCSRAPLEAQASVDDGRLWLDAMAATLARLDKVVTGAARP